MSENEKGVEVVEEELNEEIEDNDETDWKAEALKARGIAKRYQTKLEKAKETKAEPKKEEAPVKKEGFDYAKKAYLKASGIASEDYEFVHEVMTSTGKSLEDVLEAKYFQADLRERREARSTKEAIPTGTKRSASAPRDEVSYWANKPFSEVPNELKREVLKAREKVESNKSRFTDRPVGNL